MSNELDLINAVNAKRAEVARIKDEIALLQIKRNEAEAARDKAEEDYLKFMDANGLLESECDIYKAFITPSYRVDIASHDAVPDEYMRVKVSKEPDKNKIKAEMPAGNWYVIKDVRNLQIRAKKGE